MLVNINPKILVWAREESFGEAPIKQVADRIQVDLSSLVKWEGEGKDIPFETLELIAKAYKRQTATFFLQEVPSKTKKVKDYRNVAVTGEQFSYETLLAMRRTERYLRVARDLKGESYWNDQYHWTKQLTGRSSTIKKEADKLRELLSVPMDGLTSFHRADAALRFWRSRLEEKLGLFTFQFPMPEAEVDGFSFAFGSPPFAIVLNNQQAYVRRIFTLFHELFHIIQNSSGACKLDHEELKDQFTVELQCNNFAGEFLVPSRKVVEANSVDQIFELARQFSVSGEVYLRRLLEQNLIDKDGFFEWLKEVRVRSGSLQRKKKARGGPSMIIQSKSTRGIEFFNLVTNAAVANQISYSLASDLLGLKVASIGI